MVVVESKNKLNCSALFQAVLKDRDADAPRLAYAEWLAALGNPRGEFIRIQCAIAAKGWLPSGHLLRRREGELLASHAESWLKETPQLLPFYPEFGRGFVEEVTIPAARLAKEPVLLEIAPIRSLVLSAATDDALSRIVALPQLGHVRHLFLPGARAVSEIGLGNLAMLRGLRTLKLTDVVVGDSGAECLAGLTHLERLMISFASISPAGRRRLQTNFGTQLELRWS